MSAPNDQRDREMNAAAWDLATAVHLESPFYAIDAFKAGEQSLRPPELALVGDPAGKRLLHLQCHFGLDTLSLARLGAEVTGVDISPASIAAARDLAAELGLDATFVCEDVQSLGEPEECFDLVFCSYGVICWLSSLQAWANAIARNMRPGGRFVMVEFHPILEVLHPGKVSGHGRYFGIGEPAANHASGTYADPAAPISYWTRRWQHTIADVTTALTGAGLSLQDLQEYPYCSYRLCEELKVFADGVWTPEDVEGLIPYMYSVTAVAPG